MVPLGREPKEFAKVGHVELQNRHHNPWVKLAIIAAKLDVATRFLDQNALLLGFRFQIAGSVATTLAWIIFLLGCVYILYFV